MQWILGLVTLLSRGPTAEFCHGLCSPLAKHISYRLGYVVFLAHCPEQQFVDSYMNHQAASTFALMPLAALGLRFGRPALAFFHEGAPRGDCHFASAVQFLPPLWGVFPA